VRTSTHPALFFTTDGNEVDSPAAEGGRVAAAAVTTLTQLRRCDDVPPGAIRHFSSERSAALWQM
jgi:hypothetical protein